MDKKNYGSIISDERNNYAITIPHEIAEKLKFYLHENAEIKIVDGKLVMELIKK